MSVCLVKVIIVLSVMPFIACSAPYDPSRIGDPLPPREGSVAPALLSDHDLAGDASWYGERFHGRTTASGETYDMYQFTCAHRTLPFGSVIRVRREDTLQSVVVRVTDRGPFSQGRVVDLSWAAAYDLDMIERGHVPVTIEVLELGP